MSPHMLVTLTTLIMLTCWILAGIIMFTVFTK